MDIGAWVLVTAIGAALLIGVTRALGDGRFRGTRRIRQQSAPAAAEQENATESVLAGTPWEGELGERATLLQFSSAFCAPCRVARRVLEGVAGEVDGVRHLEVDAEHHLDLVRRLGVLRTPTTLVLDAEGVEVTRAAGAPTRPQVLGALADAIED